MLHRKGVPVLLLAALLLCACRPVAAPSIDAPTAAQIDRDCTAHDEGLSGARLCALYRAGRAGCLPQGLWAGRCGCRPAVYAALGLRPASVTKPLVAMAVLRLVDQGVLDLDAPDDTLPACLPHGRRSLRRHHRAHAVGSHQRPAGYAQGVGRGAGPCRRSSSRWWMTLPTSGCCLRRVQAGATATTATRSWAPSSSQPAAGRLRRICRRIGCSHWVWRTPRSGPRRSIRTSA